MDKFRFIVEQNMDEFQIINEQTNMNTEKSFKIRGPYIYMNSKNNNNRIYPESIVDKAVEDYKHQFIETRSAVGELNHPPRLRIDYDRVCHKVVSLEKHGNHYMGESIVLHGKGFPKGDILYGLLDNDIRVGISTRGAGKVSEEGIVTEYILKSFDIVSDPSGYDCFVQGIMESKEYMINEHGELVEIEYNKLEQKLSTLPAFSSDKKQYICNSIIDFINNMHV